MAHRECRQHRGTSPSNATLHHVALDAVDADVADVVENVQQAGPRQHRVVPDTLVAHGEQGLVADHRFGKVEHRREGGVHV
eukprot:CAMPEP_0174837926 /NCGR_PEP_ID=MMETSP1114-20130205/7085_1 /TAXON_ID=312471 /ORGANISM="Neobodo designis, Strain CCAP 1951/1" /LENGTH=80 /DNA_ID=CAMNT_0016072015 /DNA_START=433 /DNA_END=675 /DNA_ORIENTATION=+